MADIEYRSAFSEDGKFFVFCGTDGKLKIWDTGSGALCQEYTPNFHLSSPCTCVTWISTKSSSSSRKKKKLKILENEAETEVLALGTVSGDVELYSVAKADVVGHLQFGHNCAVNHVAWTRGCNLFSCDNQNIVEWNVKEKTVERKWKAGSERLTCLLVLPDGKSILAAGNTIGLWDVPNKQLLRRYTGHSSEINSLTFVPEGDNYFISSARNDRVLYAWSLNAANEVKNSVASFLMEDVATTVSLSSADVTAMVAVTRNGVLHMYKHQLNGKRAKPVKPEVTIQVASEASHSEKAVEAIPIVGAYLHSSDILIVHGSSIHLTFEIISPNFDEKVMILVREDPHKSFKKDVVVTSKVKLPEREDAEYIGPAATVVSSAWKEKIEINDESMEKRLDDLSLTKQDSGSHDAPAPDSMAQLLMQGLYSMDRDILQTVLTKKDQKTISSTVMRLKVQSIIPLLKELVNAVQGNTMEGHTAVLWLKEVLKFHAGHVLENPVVRQIVTPALVHVETKLSLLEPMSKLRGRLDFLADQIKECRMKGKPTQDGGVDCLVYQDQDSDDEGSALEDAMTGSELEDDWEKRSDMDVDKNMEEDELEDVINTSN